jgi:GTP-binding protein Era
MTWMPCLAPHGGARPAAVPVEGQRCGVIAIVGKPNVGKSTLLNALVGQKISITSRKAQTTRHRITGIRTREQTQFVFVDTPGFQTKHTHGAQQVAQQDRDGCDWRCGPDPVCGRGRQLHAGRCQGAVAVQAGIPTLLVANKLDMVHRRAELAPWLKSMQERHPFAEFVPMSAKNKGDIERLFGICAKYLPEQPGGTPRTS